MVDPSRQHQEVPTGHQDTDPALFAVTYVEISGPFQHQADFLVRVKVLLKKGLQLRATERVIY